MERPSLAYAGKSITSNYAPTSYGQILQITPLFNLGILSYFYSTIRRSTPFPNPHPFATARVNENVEKEWI